MPGGSGLSRSSGRVLEEEIAEGERLGSVLQRLADRYGADFRETLLDETGHLKSYVVLLVNGQVLIGPERLEAQLADGDMVIFMPFVSGG